MAGRARSSARRSAATWLPAVAVVACMLAACSGSEASSAPVPDPNAHQDPSGNPQQALLNGEVPVGNPEQPSGNSQQAPANPQQPDAPTGTSASSTPNPTSSCNSFCLSIGQNCANACARLCGLVSTAEETCLDVVSRYVSCVTGVHIICDPDGRLQFAQANDCGDESNALQACADAVTSNQRGVMTAPPPPGNGNGNGNGN